MHAVSSRQLYDDAKASLATKDKTGQVVVHRLRTTRFGRDRLGGRAIDYLTFYMSVCGQLLRITRPGDVVIAMTDPPLLSVPASLAAMLRGAVQINWLQDLFPEVAVALGVIRPGVSYRLLRHLRNRSLRHADRNVVIGERMAAHLRAQGVPEDRLTVIHNWADGDMILPLAAADNALRAEWGLAERFVVGYSGNLGRAHEFTTILGAAEILRDDTTVTFLFVGAGHHLDFIATEARRRNLPNIVIKPFQSAWRLRETLAVPDLHLVSLLPTLEGLIVPSKFYGIAAAGRPLIFLGSPAGEIAGLLRAARCGAAVAVGDAQALADHIRALRRAPARGALWGRNARALFMRRFDRPLAVAQWCDAIADAVAVPPASVVQTVTDVLPARSRAVADGGGERSDGWEPTTAGHRAR